MLKSAAKRSGKFTTLVVLSLVLAIVAGAKLINFKKNSAWQDLSDSMPTISAPSKNAGQIEGSLKNIVKQYKGIISSSQQTNKDQMFSNLDKLYQLSVNDYVNAKALENLSANNSTVNDLVQVTTFLSSSIFEMKDSMINSGEFSQQQLKNSQEDLASAIKDLERVQKGIKK
ncbi:hypothetical protein Desaci_1508 [Desulfosporosinus acidiphilus SJ4]|uniref:Uncharacterized protein n=1 Tax=Desulfosporosinus acidiphilus (strain DSM 22704 / JCM 16185 / SJ4) TaxID=646529 RepID=I4D3Z7_DESAJ|nr:hypothetical protein [Desulfosporosinus acidiphilus]AFM40521.1 hypothetical protein Desaci_1508 [Desulfosporosinus acidiphilus SJ4]